MIKAIHPFQLENIDSINDLMILLKNILRIICKQGFYYKVEDSINIPIRFSQSKDCWVFDNGTKLKRDIEGVDLNNVDRFYDCNHLYNKAIKFILNNLNEDIIKLFLQVNMKKNSNKYFCFLYKDKKNCFVEGLYDRSKSKCFYSDIDFDLLYSSFNKSKFKINNKFKTNKNYLELFDKFKSKLNKEKLFVNEKSNNFEIKLSDYIQSRKSINFNIDYLKKSYNSKSIKLFNLSKNYKIFFEIYNKNKNYLNSFLLLYINELFYFFIKEFIT